MKIWEEPPVQKSDLPLCDAGVVLTGLTHSNYLPTDQIHFSDAADRITEAIRLYDDKLIRKIVISGGSGSLEHPENEESTELLPLVYACHVHKNDIKIDKRSRNTHENAVFTKELLEVYHLEDHKILLITSAYHMPRAVKCFQKQGVEVIPYPVDYKTKQKDFSFTLLIPSIEALEIWKILIREWIGMMAYKYMGYI